MTLRGGFGPRFFAVTQGNYPQSQTLSPPLLHCGKGRKFNSRLLSLVEAKTCFTLGITYNSTFSETIVFAEKKLGFTFHDRNR